MRLKSHLHIANITADIIEEISGINLNKSYLRLGAITPDLLPNRRKQLHLPSKVASHYEKELTKIIEKGKKINTISYIVGVLTHYITDAFCLSHNIYVVNLKKHIQYEHLLDEFKYDYKIPNDIMQTIKIYTNCYKDSSYDINKYIKIMNKKYMEFIKKDDWMTNIDQDIEQSIIHVVTLLSSFILELKQQKIEAFA